MLSKSEIEIPSFWQHGYTTKLAGFIREHLLDTINTFESLTSLDPELIFLVVSLGKLWQNSQNTGFKDLIMTNCGLSAVGSGKRCSIFELFSWLGLSSFILELLEGKQFTPLVPRLEDSVESALRLAVRGGRNDAVTTILDHINITYLQTAGYEGIIADAAWSGHSGLVARVQRMRSKSPSEFGEAISAAIVTGITRFFSP